MQIHQKYKDQRVAFVSLTNTGQEGVRQFVDSFGISWPCGFSISNQLLGAFGAFNRGMAITRGYETLPTLYIVGGDGRIRWSDRGARKKHVETSKLLHDLDVAIASALEEIAE